MIYRLISDKCGSSRPGRGGLPVFKAVLAVLLACAALGGCKPSERNYHSAYDVARAKAERQEEERRELNEAMGIKGDVLQEVDGSKIENIGGRDIWTRHIYLAREDSVAPYSASIARFRMPANADALAADIRKEGFPAARTGRCAEEWYVLIGEGNAPDEVFTTVDAFRKKYPDWHYVGLPGITLLVNGTGK